MKTTRSGFANCSKINYLDRISEYNNIIDEFNKSNGFERVIGFHLEGCRGGRKRRGLARCLQYCFNTWREVRQGAEHCFHLNDVKRSTMMGHLIDILHHDEVYLLLRALNCPRCNKFYIYLVCRVM